ncbi:hypothetical protein DJ46_5616 (plasmid) [Bacillus anthracis str. Vollum]|uniref:Uncharacterized protein n=1 Tax=Bacillus anthracis TaxID=1392 RepID=Q6F013_BACAN|nr:hypothetical protein BX_A0002 [Bacillus anthracis str. A2012]AAT28743.2 hypothetical protein GBAA_pXO1_0002 [Bacillus anthracis str. 'Ames Ancestor']ACP17693.1 hypothetical protein BAMEG_A0003 [Bacillus anthracis str. CDC 684]ACQ51092.1 hypothetical protein BAA_A0003 [Bacillus anthracis str. A0248]ADK08038.1 hypothetical protein BACI_pCIXO100030 [Bacillus cereus biovar anthracis str. CI]AFH86868.1 Hypothetical Protein H9401_5483 [Bacillus anthracis str. H9401]AHK41626.1 hypothetical protei
MLYVLGFLVISIVAIRLNMKYYKLKGNKKDFVMKKNG